MLVTEHLARPAKARLHLIDSNADVVLPAELLEFLRIVIRHEIRADTLIRLEQHSGYLTGLNILLPEALQKEIERDIGTRDNGFALRTDVSFKPWTGEHLTLRTAFPITFRKSSSF